MIIYIRLYRVKKPHVTIPIKPFFLITIKKKPSPADDDAVARNSNLTRNLLMDFAYQLVEVLAPGNNSFQVKSLVHILE